MKKNLKSILAVSMALLLSIALLAGCSAAPAEQTAQLSDGGVLLLSVNPEIAVSYDNNGNVTAITARNEDAKAILTKYPDFQGKEARTVVSDLVTLIGEAGYFVEEVEGEGRHITLEIEPGSALPNETFLEDVIAEVKQAVDSHDWSAPIDIDIDDKAPPAAKPDAPGATVPVVPADPTAPRPGYTDYDDTDYGPNADGITDFGKTDYDDTDYGPNADGITDFGKTDYNDTDYGPNADGVTDYTDYNDPNTDYDNTDYGPNADGVTDYTDYGTKPTETKPSKPTKDTDYGKTDYNDPTDYGKTDYDAETKYDNATDYDKDSKYDKETDYDKDSKYDDTDYR